MPNILSACPPDLLANSATFPLEAALCPDCLLGFNATPLSDVQLRLIYDNYLYISPEAGIGHSRYEGILATLRQVFAPSDRLIEIGCSEGYLLQKLKQHGYLSVTGYEPGPQAEQAKAKGLPVIQDYFTPATLPGQQVDGFYLMHVFEHFPDPFAVLKNLAAQLTERGKIVLEVPDFGGFHHQHLFFFNPAFFRRLVHDLRLHLVQIQQENGVLRVVIGREETEPDPLPSLAEKQAALEHGQRVQDEFRRQVEQVEAAFRQSAGNALYWWGAGSTSVILLNQLPQELLRGIQATVIDGDPHKAGLHIPGVGFPVHTFHDFRGTRIPFLVIASSFAAEIRTTLAREDIQVEELVCLV